MGVERFPGATTVHGRRERRPLGEQEVHLWVVDVGPGSLDAGRYEAATTAEERNRASRFRRPGDGARYLAAHGALRCILADYLACDASDLSFDTAGGGKPQLRGSSLQFNLSHSGDLALIAVAWDRQVGVDVERLRVVADWEGVVARVCTPAEQAALRALPAADRDGAFLAMWTRKEALAKGSGEGIRGVGRDATPALQDTFRLVEVADLPGYAACVAAEGAGWQLVRPS